MRLMFHHSILQLDPNYPHPNIVEREDTRQKLRHILRLSYIILPCYWLLSMREQYRF